LFDAEEVLAEVVLFTIVGELLVHEGDEGSSGGEGSSGYLGVIDGFSTVEILDGMNA
jgi:hypothetical protein